MGHGTRNPQPGTLGGAPAAHGEAGGDRKGWVKGKASLVLLCMPNAAASPRSSNTSGAGETRTELGASKLFYPMHVMSGSEDETIGSEIVGARAPQAYLTAHYVRHTRRLSCCIACSESHTIQFLLRKQNVVLRAAFVAQRAAGLRRCEPSFQTQAAEA
jgi:hypothetical protein